MPPVKEGLSMGLSHLHQVLITRRRGRRQRQGHAPPLPPPPLVPQEAGPQPNLTVARTTEGI